MTLPAATELTSIKGTVEQVGLISRKGLGGFYELTVKTPEGEQDRVLIARDAASEQAVRALTGNEIKAKVNWSSEAVEFDASVDPGGVAPNVRASAVQRYRTFSIGGAIALGIGIFLGLATLILYRK